MGMAIDVVGIDGDDTLWHSEGHYDLTQQRYCELLAPWVDPESVSTALLDTERRNLALFGYGVKGFTLSMIETALTITEHRIDGAHMEKIVSLGKELLAHPVELLDGVAETLDVLAEHHRLVLITKGDLFHQESKVAASGVAERFESIEIVAEKDAATYARVLRAHGVVAGRLLHDRQLGAVGHRPGAGAGRRRDPRALPPDLGPRDGRAGGVAPAPGPGHRDPAGSGRPGRPGGRRRAVSAW